jgi:hypothetical protein
MRRGYFRKAQIYDLHVTNNDTLFWNSMFAPNCSKMLWTMLHCPSLLDLELPASSVGIALFAEWPSRSEINFPKHEGWLKP